MKPRRPRSRLLAAKLVPAGASSTRPASAVRRWDAATSGPRDDTTAPRDDAVATLLARANAEYRAGLDEPAAYARLWQRTRSLQGWSVGARSLMWAAALAGVALTLGSGWRSLRGGAPAAGGAGRTEITLTAERPSAGRAVSSARSSSASLGLESASVESASPGGREAAGGAVAVGAPPSAVESAVDSELESEVEGAQQAPAQPALAAGSLSQRAGQRLSEPPSAAAERSASRDPVVPSTDCLAFARDGQARAAELCFVERSRGAGLDAEMALYEIARLRRDVFGQPERALAALEESLARFPSGTLEHEARMFRLELLVQLGRAEEALATSRALLATAAGRRRAAELHVLRGHVLRQKVGDCAAAVEEYARAEAARGAGAAGGTYWRGVCLERLGDARGAIAAYQQYLMVGGRPESERARERLTRLSLEQVPEGNRR